MRSKPTRVLMAAWIMVRRISPELSNKIIQKRLAFPRQQSGTVAVPERIVLRDPAPPARWPRWGFGGGGARPPEPNEGSPMSKRPNNSCGISRNSKPRPKAIERGHKPAKLRNAAPYSKQARVLAMLRSPAGTTIGRDDEGHRLAAALGSGLPRRCGEKELKLKITSEKDRRQSRLPRRRIRRRSS